MDFSAFPGAEGSDPFALIKDDIKQLTGSVKELIGVDHPVLATVSKYVQCGATGSPSRCCVCARVFLLSHCAHRPSR